MPHFEISITQFLVKRINRKCLVFCMYGNERETFNEIGQNNYSVLAWVFIVSSIF